MIQIIFCRKAPPPITPINVFVMQYNPESLIQAQYLVKLKKITVVV